MVQPTGVRLVVPELRCRTGKCLEVPVPRIQERRWCVWGLLHGGTEENLEVTRASIGVQTIVTEILVAELNLPGQTSCRTKFILQAQKGAPVQNLNPLSPK